MIGIHDVTFSAIDTYNVRCKELLKQHSKKLMTGEPRLMVVVRSGNIWPSTSRIWKRSYFFGRISPIKVKFVMGADEHREEDGVDLGGPCREFFRMLKSSILTYARVFEGTNYSVFRLCYHCTAQLNC